MVSASQFGEQRRFASSLEARFGPMQHVDVKDVWVGQRMSGLAAPVPGGAAILPFETRVRSEIVLVNGGVGYRF